MKKNFVSLNFDLSCVAMTIILQNLDRTPWMPKLSILCVMGYIVGFAIGPGPVPWIWNTEFFKQSARAGGGGKKFSLLFSLKGLNFSKEKKTEKKP